MTTVLRTDTSAIPLAEPDTTVELRAPWLRPPVAATYRQPNVLDDLAAWWRSSPTVANFAASARSAFWPCAIGAGVIVGVLVAGR